MVTEAEGKSCLPQGLRNSTWQKRHDKKSDLLGSPAAQLPNYQPSKLYRCPRCGGARVCKAGFDAGGKQLFLCRDCVRRFQAAENGLNSVSKPLNYFGSILSSRQVCVTEAEGAKNLVTVETQTMKTVQDRKSEETLRGEIVTFKFYMTKRALAKKTIYNRARSIEVLYWNGADLDDPDSVLTVLTTDERWKPGTKTTLLQAYKSYAKWKRIDLSNVELPRFKRQEEQYYNPKETLIDQLIAGAGWKTGAFLELLKETGARAIEASGLRWIDIDGEGHIITINPAKGGRPRQIRVSEKCIQMLLRQPKNSDYVFGKDPERIRKNMHKNFYWSRGHITAKTADKTFLRIHMHTFRHFFGTKLYLQTGDLRYVQKKMGHRSITSTTIYENSEPNQQVETYTSQVAESDEEKLKLLNLGYEYSGLTTSEGYPIMRKKLVGFD